MGWYVQTAVNCVFLDNHGRHGGAVASIGKSRLNFVSCIFKHNTAARGGETIQQPCSSCSIDCGVWKKSIVLLKTVTSNYKIPISMVFPVATEELNCVARKHLPF